MPWAHPLDGAGGIDVGETLCQVARKTRAARRQLSRMVIERTEVWSALHMTAQTHRLGAGKQLCPAEAELAELYAEYKQLILAIAAALIVSQDLPDVVQQSRRLEARCMTAAINAPGPAVAAATTATALAAGELVEALASLGAPPGVARRALDQVRARHRWLRRQIWDVLPCEYPPCSSEHTHAPPTNRHVAADPRTGVLPHALGH